MESWRLVCLTDNTSAIVDASDWELISEYTWYPHSKGYAIGHKDGVYVLMHRLIMDAQPGQQVDHEDRDRRNNRRDNLEIVTNFQNSVRNPGWSNGTSEFKGVSWDKVNHKWRACISKDGKTRCLGRYKTETEAARAYDKMASELFGPLTYLNGV